MIEPGTLIDGRYLVEKTIASGGMGTVVLVRHQTLDSLHALKILHVPGKDIRERLLMEGRVQAKLKHPNIVAVTDTLLVDGSPGIVMEFVDGGSLEDLLIERALEWEVAESVFLGILSGVHFAHAHGLVHRDLKPANVLLSKLGDGLLPKVADFGIVKVLAEAQENTLGYAPTRTGIGMGTPQYMAPEQAEGASEVGPEADVFSLGCILYELTCGRRPFEAKSMLGILAGAADGMYDDPEDVRPDLPKPIVEAIRGALVPDREHRIQTCLELARIMTGGRVRSLSGVPQSHSGKPTDTVPLGRYPRGLGSIAKHRGKGKNRTWTASLPPPNSPPPNGYNSTAELEPERRRGGGLMVFAVVATVVLLIGVIGIGAIAIAGTAGALGAAWWVSADTGLYDTDVVTHTDAPGETDSQLDTDAPSHTDAPTDTDTDVVSTIVRPNNGGSGTSDPGPNNGGSTVKNPVVTPTIKDPVPVIKDPIAVIKDPDPPDKPPITAVESKPEWRLQILNSRKVASTKRTRFEYQSKKGHLLIVDVKITNNSPRSVDAPAPWRLRVGTKTFETTAMCSMAISNSINGIVEVSNSHPTTGTICFDVPKYVTGGILEFRPLSSGVATATARI